MKTWNSKSLLLGLALALLILVRPAQVCAQQPTWTFRVLVVVEPQTASYYQQQYGKPIEQIVREQMASINARFNTGTGFNARYDFRPDSIYVTNRTMQQEVFGAHPGFAYKIVINGFSDNAIGGGWYGDYQTIYHSWQWSGWGGPFAGYATDGLTHELAHARGAVDIYAMRVDASKNPITGTAFEPVSSVMNYPYDNVVWDEYTTNLLNSTADGPITGDAWITQPFPSTLAIRTLDQDGSSLVGASVEMYPVDWFSYTLSATPVYRLNTDLSGTYQFKTNPYGVPAQAYPWHIRYANFLVKASYNKVVVYKWLPLYDVQNAYFRNGANSAYTLYMQLPTPPSPIQLTSINSTSFCASGGQLEVSVALNGTFGADNQFRLQLSDIGGNFDNGTNLATLSAPSVTTLSGWLSSLMEGGNYRIRVISSSPAIESGVIPISVNPKPSAPVVSPLYLCHNSPAQPLQATGENLRWYSSPSGGTGSVVAPVVSTSATGFFSYYVTQTVNGCESIMRQISVAVEALRSVKSGPWTDPTVWSCNRVPTEADEVVISYGHAVTISGTLKIPKKISFVQTGKLVFQAEE